jgi:adenine-specific DNA-methyltransferase
VDKKFSPSVIASEAKQSQYRFLPIDTKYFKDVELEILGLFDNLDASLDGWLIKSENYQALNTILPKFKSRVKCVHIDPPYNTDTSGFLYKNEYKHSSWLTMMENRTRLAYELLSTDGSFLCHIDENEYERLQLMLDSFQVPDAGTVVWDKKNPMLGRKGIATQHEYIIWRSLLEGQIYSGSENSQLIIKKAQELISKYGGVTDTVRKKFSDWISKCEGLSGGEKAYRLIDDDGRVFQSVAMGAPEPRQDKKFFIPLKHPVTKKPCPVPSNGWSRSPDTLKQLMKKNEIIFGKNEKIQPRRKVYLTVESKRQLSSVIQDAHRGKNDVEALGLDFPYCHPVSLYEELLGAAAPGKNDIVMDYFAGSGTTAHALININRNDNGRRKYIIVEMADYANDMILPRIKKLIVSDKWDKGKVQDGQGISHFIKYYELEQYEEALANAKYKDGDLFNVPDKEPYSQYVFMT